MINIQICSEAKKKIDEGAWNYLVGGAENELALRRNRHAFQRWSFNPQGLHDVSEIDPSSTFLGISLRMPVIAAPIGGLTQFHERGDLEWAKGLSDSKITGTISGVARVKIEDIFKETTNPFFFQLYFFGNDEWIKEQVRLAERCGSKAIVVTADTKYFGQRERDIIGNYDSRNAGWRTAPPPPDRSRNSTLDWSELEKIRSYTKLPFIIKGIISLDDVKKAIEVGADAVWISNHGGRQLDYVSASLSSLSSLVPYCKKKATPIIFDGGVRRGSEVLMAYLLGADVIALGRLPVYGLIFNGAKGIKQVFENLEEELIRTMGLVGLTNLNFDRGKVAEKLIQENITGLETVWDKLES